MTPNPKVCSRESFDKHLHACSRNMTSQYAKETRSGTIREREQNTRVVAGTVNGITPRGCPVAHSAPYLHGDIRPSTLVFDLLAAKLRASISCLINVVTIGHSVISLHQCLVFVTYQVSSAWNWTLSFFSNSMNSRRRRCLATVRKDCRHCCWSRMTCHLCWRVTGLINTLSLRSNKMQTFVCPSVRCLRLSVLPLSTFAPGEGAIRTPSDIH